MPNIDVANIRYVAPDQFRSLLDAIEDNAGRFRRRADEFKPWFPLALRAYRATGARPAEIVGKSARVRRTEEEGYAEQSGIQEHHGLRARDILGEHQATFADSAAYRELQDLAVEAREPTRHLLGLGPAERRHGDGYWQLTRQVRKLRPFLAGPLRDFEVRWLRHSWAIHALRNGIDIYEVARQLGHANIQVTAIYLRFAPVERERVMRAFDS